MMTSRMTLFVVVTAVIHLAPVAAHAQVAPAEMPQAAPAAPPAARPTGLPSNIVWRFNLDAGWGTFGR